MISQQGHKAHITAILQQTVPFYFFEGLQPFKLKEGTSEELFPSVFGSSSSQSLHSRN